MTKKITMTPAQAAAAISGDKEANNIDVSVNVLVSHSNNQEVTWWSSEVLVCSRSGLRDLANITQGAGREAVEAARAKMMHDLAMRALECDRDPSDNPDTNALNSVAARLAFAEVVLNDRTEALLDAISGHALHMCVMLCVGEEGSNNHYLSVVFSSLNNDTQEEAYTAQGLACFMEFQQRIIADMCSKTPSKSITLH